MNVTMSRRDALKMLGLIGGAVAAVPAISSCSPSSKAGSGATQTTKRGGTLVVNRSSAWTTMDAHLSQNYDPDYAFMFDYLTRYEQQQEGAGFKVLPSLAKSWTRPDPLTYDFELEQGVTFHDGSPFNAEVAQWNLQRMISHPKSAAKDQTASIASVKATGDHTLRVTLKAPDAAILVKLSSAANSATAMQSKAYWDKQGDAGLAAKAVGTGPFTFQSLSSDQLSMGKFDGYRGSGQDGKPLPYFDSVNSVLQANTQTALLRLRSGDFNIVSNIAGADVKSLKGVNNVEVKLAPWQGDIFCLVFNARPGGKFAGDGMKTARQAISMAIDAQSAADVVGAGIGSVAYGPLVPGQLAYSTQTPIYPHDTAKAKSLLQEAGLSGAEITLDFISRPDDLRLAQLYQQMLSDAGLKVNLQPSDKVAWTQKIKNGNFELGSFFTRSAADPDIIMSSFMTSSGTTNYSGWSNPDVEALIKQARSGSSDSARADAYAKILQIAHDEAYYDFVWIRQGATAFSSKLVNYTVPFTGRVTDGLAAGFSS